MSDTYELSSLEQLVVLSALRTFPEAYGVSIFREIEQQTDKRPSLAAIYAALDRLTKVGAVTQKIGEATALRGGRAKTYFEVTVEGRKALKKSLRPTDNMRIGLEEVLS